MSLFQILSKPSRSIDETLQTCEITTKTSFILIRYFANVGPNTENTIPKVPNISPLKFLKDRIQVNFIIAHISNEEILDIINALENKSTGPSGIPFKLLNLILSY